MKTLHRQFMRGICLVWVLLFCLVEVGAQDSRDPVRKSRSALDALRDSIGIVNEDIRLLQHFLEASTADPRMYQNSLAKSWIIRNPELRDSLFYALVLADSSVESEAGAEPEVLATLNGEIIEVRYGSAVFKGTTLRDALAKSADKRLYEKIVASGKYSKDIETRDPELILPTSYEPELIRYDKLLEEFTPVIKHKNPADVKGIVDASLYGIIFKMGPRWGGEIKIGNDEIGYPFWSSGKMAFLATYKQVKFGFELPFRGGRFSSDVFPPFTLRGRRLNGSRGIVGEFDFGPAGGLFSITRLTEHDTKSLTNPDDFAYITVIGLGYYSFGVSLNPTNLVRAKVGAGYHRVREARVIRRIVDSTSGRYDEFIGFLGQRQFASPYIRFEYINRDIAERFGASIQFYDYILLTTAWLEIVPDVLRLELKYSWKVLRDLRKWEQTDFIVISPRIKFAFK
jgi:hypothetical protein